MTRLDVAFDMRAPEWATPAEDLYRAALEIAAWADSRSFSGVILMEHHASTDGYLPSPIVMGAGVAAVTRRLAVRLSLIILPLYDPLRAAEDLAVLDLLCRGRLEVAVGLGYRQEEYDQFGMDIRRRPSRMEKAVETLKQAWTGEPFDYEGRTVRILPRPARRPRPPIYMGGASPASARRAARIADGYRPVNARLYGIYEEELAKLGRVSPGPAPAEGRGYIFVSEDPDRDWARLAPHAVHDAAEYARWIGDRPGMSFDAKDAAELRRTGPYRVVTPDECLEIAREEKALTFKPLVGGLAPEAAWAGLELFAAKVLPHIGPDHPQPAQAS